MGSWIECGAVVVGIGIGIGIFNDNEENNQNKTMTWTKYEIKALSLRPRFDYFDQWQCNNSPQPSRERG